MTARRLVRVTDQFVERLDELLPTERSVDGAPSATDFLLHEMPPIIETLATEFDDVTTPIPDQPRTRVLIAAGTLVPYLAVYAELIDDDNVEVFYLDVG